VKGRTRHHRRCGLSRFDRSAIANATLHNMKFPQPPGFAIIYLLTTTKKGMSSFGHYRQFDVQQQIVWFFKRKVQTAMQVAETGIQPVNNVEVDEIFVDGREEGKPGRSKGSKRLALVSGEFDYGITTKKTGKLKRCNARVIDDASGETPKRGLEESVEITATVITNGWMVCLKALPGRWRNIDVSAQGLNFDAMHGHILNLKNLVRGIHHHISRKHLQSHLNGFSFRFNNR
jgi:hypothetical protein